jgi:hypothetical protein
MRFRTLAVALAATALATLIAPEAHAQLVRAEGQITDTWGNPLEGVQVDARRQDGGGSSFSAVTDEDGEYLIIGLETTAYEFTYTLAGYQGVRQFREMRSQGGAPGRRRRRPAPIELEVVPLGQVLNDEFEYEAEGGTPSLTLKSDGMFEFEDAEGEGEGNYHIQDLNAVLTVRDYDGPDDKYTVREPVVVTARTNQFLSLAWGETTLNKK